MKKKSNAPDVLVIPRGSRLGLVNEVYSAIRFCLRACEPKNWRDVFKGVYFHGGHVYGTDGKSLHRVVIGANWGDEFRQAVGIYRPAKNASDEIVLVRLETDETYPDVDRIINDLETGIGAVSIPGSTQSFDAAYAKVAKLINSDTRNIDYKRFCAIGAGEWTIKSAVEEKDRFTFKFQTDDKTRLAVVASARV